MIGVSLVNSMYDDLVKEIEKYQKDYKIITDLIFGKNDVLRKKLCDSCALTGIWPGAMILNENGNPTLIKLNGDTRELTVDISIWIDTKLQDEKDISKEEERCYNIDYINEYVIPKIECLAEAKKRLCFVKDNLGEIKTKLDENCESLISDAATLTGNIHERFRGMQKYNLVFEKFDI